MPFLSCFPRINAVSNGQVRGDSYSEGCLGQTGTWGGAGGHSRGDTEPEGLCQGGFVGLGCPPGTEHPPSHSRGSDLALHRFHDGFWVPHCFHVDPFWGLCG